jgi:hypothetical protein
MSHTSQIELEVTDLGALEEAAKSLGLEYIKGQKTFRQFAGQNGRCQHAIRVPNNSQAMEIGVSETGRPGRFRLETDFYNRGYGLQDFVGQDAMRLKQAYTTEYTKRQWKKKGFKVKTTTDEQGYVTVTATRPRTT